MTKIKAMQNQWRIQTFRLGVHEAPKAPSWVGCGEGAMPPPQGAMPLPRKFFQSFIKKWRVLVDSDV